jgi:hypothetical protein
LFLCCLSQLDTYQGCSIHRPAHDVDMDVHEPVPGLDTRVPLAGLAVGLVVFAARTLDV